MAYLAQRLSITLRFCMVPTTVPEHAMYTCSRLGWLVFGIIMFHIVVVVEHLVLL